MTGTLINASGILLGSLAALLLRRDLGHAFEQRIRYLVAIAAMSIGCWLLWKSTHGGLWDHLRQFLVIMTGLLAGNPIGLALGLILIGSMWVFYTRNPDNFSIGNFWAYLKPWLTTTDHKQVGILYFLYGFFFFLVGGLLALLFRIQLALPENDFLTYDEYNSFLHKRPAHS